MSKTLYISDLDGTLLNKSQQISSYTADILNSYIDKGLTFSYATARSIVTASKVTANITKSLPVIVFNGCFIMDSMSDEILAANYFSKIEYSAVLNDLYDHKIEPIVHSFINGAEKFSYNKEKINIATKNFVFTRQDERNNPTDNLSFSFVEKPFYIACIADTDLLAPIYEKYKDILSCVFYKDIYSNNQHLEVMPFGVNKANAIMKLKEILGCDKIIAFGDGENDIAMFKLADECYAVENAVEGLKKIATAVIQANENDGVAKWLESNVRL